MEDKLEALIVKTLDYQEHSQLVYFYTPHGMQSALARGVKKMSSALRPYIQVGNHVTLSLSKGKLPTIKEAEKMDTYAQIKSDLVKTTVLNSFLETVSYTVSKEDNHEKLFPFLIKCNQALKDSFNPLELSLLFDLKMLYFLGYGLDFKACHVCGMKEDLVLDTYTGMVSCKLHQELNHVMLDEQDFYPLKYYLYADVTDFESLTLTQETWIKLMHVMDQLYKEQTGTTRKSKKILYTLL